MTRKEAFLAGAAAAVKTFSAPKMPGVAGMPGMSGMSGIKPITPTKALNPIRQAADTNMVESTINSTSAKLAPVAPPSLV